MSASPIVFVIGSLDVGGSEHHLTQIVPRLHKRGWRPIVYCLSGRGELACELESEGIPLVCSPIASLSERASRVRRVEYVAATMVSLAKFMWRTQPAIAHFFLPYPYIIGAPAALLARVPVRIMSRRSLNDYQKRHALAARIEPRLHRTVTAIVANSRRVIKQLHDEEGVPYSRLGLIYNGVNVAECFDDEQRRAERAALNVHSEALTYIIVANLIPYKGHADLLAAFGLAAHKLPAGWRLLVVGRNDGIESQLRSQAAFLGIADNVLFLGQRRDVPNILRAVDVGILSSHQEGFSNAILEYMEAGLPSIVTDVGGNSEAILNGDNGLVVPSHDPASLAEAIICVGNDPDRRKKMGGRSRRRVKEHFGIDACVACYDGLYRGLLAGLKPQEIDCVRAS